MKIPYVLIKHGMYYAHGSCGYVSRVLMAELYDEAYALNYAKQHDEVFTKPITECLTGAEEVQSYLDRIEVMRDVMLSNQ